MCFELDFSKTEKRYGWRFDERKKLANDTYLKITGQNMDESRFLVHRHRPICPEVMRFVSWISENNIKLAQRAPILALVETYTGFRSLSGSYKIWVMDGADAALVKLTWC